MTQTAITAAFLPQMGPVVDRRLAHPKPGSVARPGHRSELARPRFGRAAVWAESPLQLLSAVEAHGAGLLGQETLIHPRSDAVGMDSTLKSLMAQVPSGVRFTPPSSALPAVRSRKLDRWVTGDAYSGKVQTELLRGVVADELVIVDDGLATLSLLKKLVSDGPTPLIRPRAVPTMRRKALGLATWWTLRRMASQGRLLVFTALSVPDAVEKKFRALGGHLERHRFEWLGTQPVTETIHEPTIVVGSAMPADKLIRPEPYKDWVRSLTEEGPVAYFPHRREQPDLLNELDAHPMIRVKQHTIPVEMRLRGLRPGQVVRALPSTVLASLRLILTPSGVPLKGQPVPDDWWLPETTEELRRHLSSSLRDGGKR
ncbi:hypothetical protein ACWF5H_01065 [Arthrobacter sp. NPDC055138]